MNFVLDASVALSWLLVDSKPTDRVYAALVLETLKRPDIQAQVPVTWGLEVANVLARAEATNRISEAQSEAFLAMLSHAPIVHDAATFVHSLADTLQLARRYRLSAYDASYLELALRGGYSLATLDADLGKAARKAGVKGFSVK